MGHLRVSEPTSVPGRRGLPTFLRILSRRRRCGIRPVGGTSAGGRRFAGVAGNEKSSAGYLLRFRSLGRFQHLEFLLPLGDLIRAAGHAVNGDQGVDHFDQAFAGRWGEMMMRLLRLRVSQPLNRSAEQRFGLGVLLLTQQGGAEPATGPGTSWPCRASAFGGWPGIRAGPAPRRRASSAGAGSPRAPSVPAA